MALQKQIETPEGFTADYWRIVQINMDVANRRSHVVLALYLNETARRAGKPPCQRSTLNFDWNGPDYPFIRTQALATVPAEEEEERPTILPNMEDNSSLEIAYLKIKEAAELSNAEDVREDLEPVLAEPE